MYSFECSYVTSGRSERKKCLSNDSVRFLHRRHSTFNLSTITGTVKIHPRISGLAFWVGVRGGVRRIVAGFEGCESCSDGIFTGLWRARDTHRYGNAPTL